MKQTFKSAGTLSINFGDNVIEYSHDFRLYITTKHSNPHYLPELSTKVTLINFMITFDGLAEYLLNLVVQKENAVLDEERQKLIVQSYENNKQLKDIENQILDILRKSEGNILEDEKAIDILKQSQVLSQQIKEKQEAAKITEEKLEEARKSYNPIAYHSSLLFFIIQKLSHVDIMYQYSLTWFIQLFLIAIEKSEKSEYVDQRVESLTSYFTYSLYSNVCRSLFEKHKLLFSFILTSKLKEAEGAITSTQFDILISTLPGLENPLDMDNPSEDWLSNHSWNRLCQLAKTEAIFYTIAKNFKTNESLWKQINESNQPMQEQFPMNEQNEQFTLFQKLCIIKMLRSDKLIPAVQEYVVNEMGEKFVNPPPFDLDLSYSDSTNATPLIFVLPGADPLQSLTNFAQQKKKLEQLKIISLGQGQGPKAEYAIEQAKQKGGWVLLQNCHLYPSWMPKLERICEQLEMKSGSVKDQTHPSFRLWLTSYPSNDFPALILQNGIKMTNEPPKGLKANMYSSYKLEPISDHSFLDQHSKPANFKKLLYGLCMFHGIIQERRNYGALGWNIRYDFTVSDLQISVKQLHLFTNQYDQVPFEALEYLTGECNYGGRVTDERDRRVLKALLKDFYNSSMLYENYKVFGMEQCQIPHGNLPYNQYLESIQCMPLEDTPSLFGFHPNANITKDLKETSELCYDLLKMGDIEGVKSKSKENQDEQNFMSKNKEQETKESNRPEVVIEKTCKDILQKLPSHQFDIEFAESKYPLVRENSMNTFLVQELTRFNGLLFVITSSLKNILLALQGEVLLSEQLENVYNSLLIGEIPEMWLKVSYPSLKPVASYIKDLGNRLNSYENWINNGPTNVYWISGFFFTQSFLTGVFQNYARKYKVEIDTLAFDFQFLDEDPTDYDNEIYNNENSKHQTPEDGALISGLYLEGARWDYQQECLAESLPKVLFTKVPIIWLQPRKIDSLQDKDRYECPVYKTAERKGVLSTTGHSTNFILNINTPQGNYDPSHWVKRGVAMLCQLSN